MLDYRVLIHYHNQLDNYAAYNMWKWQMNQWGEEASFFQRDDFGIQGNLSYKSNQALGYVHVIVKTIDWSHQSVDYSIQLLPPHLVTEIWIIEGDSQVYYSRQAAMTSPYYAKQAPHAFDMALDSKRFDQHWGYQGWLGCRYDGKKAEFKLWAPTAKKVQLVVYKNGSNRSKIWKVYDLQRGKNFSKDHSENTIGIWSRVISDDLADRAYQYQLEFEHHKTLTRDPYAEATTEDGKRSVILSPTERNPKHFQVKQGQQATWRLDNPCQAVIYEMHVRDLTKSSSSGVSKKYRGTFLGACQKGTKNRSGQATGFDYIQSLGINVVQLQPISDRHKEYDWHGNVTYNWGYDPQNYNAPETSFSTNPTKPSQGMRDLKTMIQAYHDAGISVVIDVVYNHIYSTYDSPFQATMPDYYYRMNPDGSFQNGTGVGSETASEHEMFRKYMIDSLLYWVKEYNIDGFRFDLMGIHDIETMRQIREALDEIDPRILTYGEGWDMGTGLLPLDKAKKDNAFELSNIGFFNDTERDAIKGAEVYGGLKAGFVSGEATEAIIAKAILGSNELGTYLTPNQVVNYVEAHDNYNLHDLLVELHPDDDDLTRTKRIELATAMNLLLQGMSFMELGQEFSRSKLIATGENGQTIQEDHERAMNSYNAPDTVNQVDWDLIADHQESIDYIKKIIHLKTMTKEFSYQHYEDIYQHVFVHSAHSGSGIVIFEVKDEKYYLIIFNASGQSYNIEDIGNLRLVAGNSRQVSDSFVEDLTATVFEVVEW
ncbi:pullulanase [Streptococcus milleri]|uniref:type I pullulanase n=1 Tax=Streptococcus milleri TaxID=33040 RepID=UPI000F6F5E21|nr:type I pullulanase [Streptococcus milleri]VEE81467.1 pullulanase [Streptococcus milleri]